jgi:hypothetical protein
VTAKNVRRISRKTAMQEHATEGVRVAREQISKSLAGVQIISVTVHDTSKRDAVLTSAGERHIRGHIDVVIENRGKQTTIPVQFTSVFTSLGFLETATIRDHVARQIALHESVGFTDFSFRRSMFPDDLPAGMSVNVSEVTFESTHFDVELIVRSEGTIARYDHRFDIGPKIRNGGAVRVAQQGSLMVINSFMAQCVRDAVAEHLGKRPRQRVIADYTDDEIRSFNDSAKIMNEDFAEHAALVADLNKP